MRGKKIVFPLIAALLAAVMLVSGCGSGAGKANGPKASGKIRFCATVFPVYDFARNIGGDRVEVYTILPPGSDPHHWEPAPGDIINIMNSDVFAYCGAGLESWAEGALKNAGPGKTVVVDCSRGIDLLVGGHDHEDGRGDEAGEKQGQGQNDKDDHAGVDPHIWLDPVNAGIMVDNILEGMVRADPANRDYYTANASEFKARLADLDARYRAGLAGARVRRFVVSHDAFGYLAKRYGLAQVPVRGLSADIEPGPARMAQIVEDIRRQGIKYVFVEPMVSPRVTETIARETGAGVLVLDPAAAVTEKDIKGGRSYLSIMGDNLENLRKACEAR